jgi:predicted TIM-barrel fold metal-dependent hydrolase
VRAIDFHVHLPTPDWLDGSMAGYVEAAEAYFRSRVERQSLESLAAKYRSLDALAVLLAWDAETATGRPRVPNATVAAAAREHPDAFTGIGSVDPHKESAVDEVAEIAALGLRGVKFHPSLQAFAPDDEKFWPVFAACEAHGLLALFHTGTSGIGARRPGGQGIRLDYAHPLKLDAVAAAFPALTVVAAHFGYPWHMDLLAMALHKTNVYIDISGWSPRRIPAEVTRELKGRLAGQFVWGSDFPFIAPERCLAELTELGLDSPVLLHDNAARVLGLPALPLRAGRLVLAELLERVVGGRAGRRGAQHRGLPHQQRALEPQPLERRRGGEQRLPLGQVDDHRGADHVGEQHRLVRQVGDADHAAAPVGQRVQVGAEARLHPADRERLRLPGAGGGLVLERLDLTLEVRPRVVHAQQPEPLGAHGGQVEPAIRMGRDLPDGRHAADLVQRGDAVRADLPALADRDHPKPLRLGLRAQVRDEHPVALLENVQRQAHAREKHRGQREQGQQLAHIQEITSKAWRRAGRAAR